MLGTADADRDESGSGDDRLRKIRVDKTGTQNYNTTKLRNRGYQRWTRCTAYRCTGTTIDSACIKVKTTILHRYRRWLCCTCVEDKAKGNHTGRKRNTPCGFSLPFFILHILCTLYILIFKFLIKYSLYNNSSKYTFDRPYVWIFSLKLLNSCLPPLFVLCFFVSWAYHTRSILLCQ